MIGHIRSTATRFVWGEDVGQARSSCSCGWVGSWLEGTQRDGRSFDQWLAHVRDVTPASVEGDPPLDPPPHR